RGSPHGPCRRDQDQRREARLREKEEITDHGERDGLVVGYVDGAHGPRQPGGALRVAPQSNLSRSERVHSPVSRETWRVPSRLGAERGRARSTAGGVGNRSAPVKSPRLEASIEERELTTLDLRAPEGTRLLRGGDRGLAEAESFGGAAKQLCDRLGVGPFADEAAPEARVVELATPDLARAGEHAFGAQREGGSKPLLEDVLHVPRKAQDEHCDAHRPR